MRSRQAPPERPAELRVVGHDPAGTERVADLRQRRIERLGEAPEPLEGGLVRVVRDDQAIVLVRVQQHLAAAAGAHDDEREARGRRPAALALALREHQLDHAVLDRQVQVGQRPHRERRAAVRLVRAAGRIRDPLEECRQRLEIGRRGDLVVERLRRRGESAHQVRL